MTGERGHYELAAGGDVAPYARALEQFAVGIGLIPEQIWDQQALPDRLLAHGGPTGAALPLLWAHAEYIKLVRSIADRRVFDLIEPVRSRYLGAKRQASRLEVWSENRPVTAIPAGARLRIIAGVPFEIEWTTGDPPRRRSRAATPTGVAVWCAEVDAEIASPIRFTLRATVAGTSWEREHVIAVTSPTP